MKTKLFPIVCLAIMSYLATYCKKEESATDFKKEKHVTIPTLSTSEVTGITGITVFCGGVITDDGGADIIACGICWSTNINPTINDSKTVQNTQKGQFVSSIVGLTCGTTYHVRAYATNPVGTAYGSDILFTTLETPSPFATTDAATNQSMSGATLNGAVRLSNLPTTVTFEYGISTSYGHEVRIERNPVTGDGMLQVSATITNLNAGTEYHFRVKAVNIQGTFYGEDVKFSTNYGQASGLYVYIPDPIFKNALISGVDKNADGEISFTEAEAFTGNIDVPQSSISDLTGIEAFVNVQALYCQLNQLTNLDISKNTVLTQLICDDNLITSLNVSGHSALQYISCQANRLTKLDVSGCTGIMTLLCRDNQLTSLDVSGFSKLESLACPNNKLISLNITGCDALKSFDCHNNQLTGLDVSDFSILEHLNCSNNLLPSLNITECTILKFLACSNNKLITLDVSTLVVLMTLACDGNQLSSLDLSKNTKLLTSTRGFYQGTLNLSNMPTLGKVCVWQTPFPPAGKEKFVYTAGSPNIYFTTNCNK